MNRIRRRCQISFYLLAKKSGIAINSRLFVVYKEAIFYTIYSTLMEGNHMKKTIAVIRGDGIGPEIVNEAIRALDRIAT